MSDEKLNHQRGREMNEKRIADQLRRINSEIMGGKLTEKQITDEARKRANAAAERAVRDEK